MKKMKALRRIHTLLSSCRITDHNYWTLLAGLPVLKMLNMHLDLHLLEAEEFIKFLLLCARHQRVNISYMRVPTWTTPLYYDISKSNIRELSVAWSFSNLLWPVISRSPDLKSLQIFATYASLHEDHEYHETDFMFEDLETYFAAGRTLERLELATKSRNSDLSLRLLRVIPAGCLEAFQQSNPWTAFDPKDGLNRHLPTLKVINLGLRRFVRQTATWEAVLVSCKNLVKAKIVHVTEEFILRGAEWVCAEVVSLNLYIYPKDGKVLDLKSVRNALCTRLAKLQKLQHLSIVVEEVQLLDFQESEWVAMSNLNNLKSLNLESDGDRLSITSYPVILKGVSMLPSVKRFSQSYFYGDSQLEGDLEKLNISFVSDYIPSDFFYRNQEHRWHHLEE